MIRRQFPHAGLFCSFLIHILTLVRAEIREDLNGEWVLQKQHGLIQVDPEIAQVPAKVPGGVYSDLMNNKIIGDVLYGDNDTETRWVGLTNWQYSRNFTVDDAVFNFESINIVFEGLDTYADIYLNGKEIGRSRNMFVQYIFDIKNTLKAGNNSLQVEFTSPVEMAKNLTHNQMHMIPPECPPGLFNGECHVNQLRKMQASFAWDWGPAFPSVGIWKAVHIEAFNESVIRYLLVETISNGDSWDVQVKTYLSNNKHDEVKGQLSLELDLKLSKITEESPVIEKSNHVGEIIISHTFSVPKVQVNLWWPNGYGDQTLYTLKATFFNTDRAETSEKSIEIGFRTIELVQDDVSKLSGGQGGLSFYFKVNDVPIFAKGSNSIPLDVLPERGQNEETVSRLLETARDSHMNMLRVWGGGVYESDHFYSTCDRLGILVWQDFMFACALYPTDDEFLSNVRDEVQHQVKRLNHHPSIVLWAGNNENELALAGSWFGTWGNFSLYKSEYVKLYIDTIKAEVNRISDRIIFLSSSPTNGKESTKQGYVAKNPGDSLYGDVHFYNYIFDGSSDATYPIPRFASEYGYQSMPSVETFLKYTDSVDNLKITSDFMEHRQHHRMGNTENERFVGMTLGSLNTTSPNYYMDFIYCSQIVQAVYIKAETEHYRRHMSALDGTGHGLTMGALYWQLNDVWVAPTWSGIDYLGQWKMLQYHIKNAFSPLIVTGYVDAVRNLNIYVVSDLQTLVSKATISIKVFDFNSLQPKNQSELTIDIESLKSQLVFSTNIDDYLKNSGCASGVAAKENCFVYLILENNGVAVAPDNFVFAGTNLRSSTKPKLQIANITQTDESGKSFALTVTTDGTALFVWLDTHGIAGRFSENGFMQVTSMKTIYFTSEEPASLAVLKDTLTVICLMDVNFT